MNIIKDILTKTQSKAYNQKIERKLKKQVECQSQRSLSEEDMSVDQLCAPPKLPKNFSSSLYALECQIDKGMGSYELINQFVQKITTAIEYYENIHCQQKYIYFKLKLKNLWSKKQVQAILNKGHPKPIDNTPLPTETTQPIHTDPTIDKPPVVTEVKEQHRQQLEKIKEQISTIQLASIIDMQKVNVNTSKEFKSIMKKSEINTARDMILQKVQSRKSRKLSAQTKPSRDIHHKFIRVEDKLDSVQRTVE